MQSQPPQTLEILHPSNVGAARRAAKILAKGIGFDSAACEEIALAMTELATNLIKHAQGGMLTLTPLADGGRVGLEIESRDDGPGIAQATNLFVPFFTTKPEGSGIGLVLCRQIAENHGGTLTLANRQDASGCVATLRLPA